MKQILLTLTSVLFCAITFAQSVPQGINYQAVARDASGAVLMNQALTIQFSIISDITTGNVSWQETHQDTTNDYGLFTAVIGQGTSTSGGSSATFDVIDWGASNHLLKLEIDYGSGLVDMGTTAFMSVPYALNSTPQSLTISGDTLFIGSGSSIIIPGLRFINSLIVQGCTDSLSYNYNSSANTDDGSCTGALSLGDTLRGGIVFYLDGIGGGLIAASTDQSIGAEWGCYGTSIGTTIYGPSTGVQNTIDIELGCTTLGTAADICANLTLNGYDDWFLPSILELNQMYLNIGQGNAWMLGNVGGFSNNAHYWSSSEGNLNNAWSNDFSNNSGNIYQSKSVLNYVRAIRSF